MPAGESTKIPDRLARLEKDLKRAVLAAQTARIELTGGVDADYTWNTNDPPRRVDANRLFTSNPDHNTFAIAWAKLGIARTVSPENEWDAGARFEIAFGRLAEKTLSLDPEFLFQEDFNIAQAYVDLQAPTPANPLLLRFGRFYSWFGAESLDPWKNPFLSHSWTFVFTPFTTTGVSVGMKLGAGFSYTQYVVNGWDVVLDNNDSKSVGGQLAWTREDDPKVSIAFNWIFGPELRNNNHSNRTLVELAAIVRPFPGTDLRLCGNYGYEEDASLRNSRGASFGGVTLIAAQEFLTVDETLRRFGVGVRGTYYRDQGASRTRVDVTLAETTGGAWVNFTSFARLRVEYRHDWSSRDFFFGHRGRPNAREQGTFAADAHFYF